MSYPSPGHFVCEGSADERTQHRSDTIGSSGKSKELGSHLRGRSEAEHREHTDGDTRAT
jgi:hypothetical protein